jgi:hypothetical protein
MWEFGDDLGTCQHIPHLGEIVALT